MSWRSPAGTVLLLAVAGFAPTACGVAPGQAPAVSLGYGVDTTDADVGAVVRLVRAYLARPDTTARARGLWSPADSAGRGRDRLAPLGFQTLPATVLGVLAEPPGDSVYAVRVLYARPDSARGQAVPLALQRLYAVRAPGSPHGWQLAGALPRLTRDWDRLTVGRIAYRYEPGQRPDTARAVRAARFVDSVAALFAVAAPSRVDYYVTASPEANYRALGLDFYPLPSGPGGGRGGNGGREPGAETGFVLAGDPRQGEAYLHELTHAVLGGRLGGGGFIAEGVATWLGGSKGQSPPALYAALAAFQRAHPDATLAGLVRGDGGGGGEVARDDARYASGALVVDALYRRAGGAGLRALRTAPDAPPDLLRFLAVQLGLPPDNAGALEQWWRRTVAEVAARGPGGATTR